MPTVADLTKETITVTQVGKFGPKVGDVWYSVNEPLTPTDFQVSHTYDVLVKISKPSVKNPAGGKKYISQIIGESNVQPIVNTVDKTNGIATTPKVRDFDREARGKSRFGLYAAALQSPALAGMQFTGVSDFCKLVREVANDGIDYTFEGK